MRWGLLVGFVLERGSSFSRESLREDDMPDGEELRDPCSAVGVDEANEASSSESRSGWFKGFWSSEKPSRDISTP